MNKVHQIVVKLTKALKQTGNIYIVSKKQYYNAKMGKVLTIVQLRKIVTREEYMKEKPNYRGKKEYFDVVLIESFREVEILNRLVEIYKEVRHIDGETAEIRT